MQKWRFSLSVLFVLAVFCQQVWATGLDVPQVPEKMTFAGIKLELSSHVQKEIQSNVDALMRSPKYFQLKVDRFASYHPIIERVFIEEGLPLDFKFLIIQESGMVSDAVSSSNAVGFWQFKAPTAREVGLRVDNDVDERMNIVSSSRGAARYLKNNNARLDNWTYALLSYMTGLGGVQQYVDRKYVGKKSMKLEKGTHWYIIKLLSHKIAFEHQDISKPTVNLVEYIDGGNKTLDNISRETKSDPQLVTDYNKWLKARKVPTDKEYTVILPVDKSQFEQILADGDVRRADVPQEKAIKARIIRDANSAIEFEWNNIDAVIASAEDNKNSLALVGDMSKRKFMRINDLNPRDEIQEGQVYYLKRKKRKANVPFHTLQPDETIWDVSQKYGIKMRQVYRRSRLKQGQAVEPGTVLWLRKRRPRNQPLEVVEVEEPIVKENQSTQLPREIQARKQEVEPVKEYEQPKQELKKVEINSNESPKKTEELEPADEAVTVEKKTNPTHTVQKGETLYGISKMYGVKVEQLIHWNSLSGGSLREGQVLRVVELTDVKTNDTPDWYKQEVILHEVKQGETLYQISRKYAVSVDDLLKVNGKSTTELSIGDILKIPAPQR